MAHDEILEAVVREQLRDQGLDDDSIDEAVTTIDEAVTTMRDQGMFTVPDWA